MLQLWLHVQRGERACLLRYMCTTRPGYSVPGEGAPQFNYGWVQDTALPALQHDAEAHETSLKDRHALADHVLPCMIGCTACSLLLPRRPLKYLLPCLQPLALDLEQLETIVPHGSSCAASRSSRTARQSAMLDSRYEAANTVCNSRVRSTAISIGADWQHSVNVEQPPSAGPTSTKAYVRVGKHAPISTNACPGSGTLQIASAFSSSTNSANAQDSSIAMSASAQCGSQLTAGSGSGTGGARVLQVQKRHAKTAKDALKALGFLDRHGRVIQADRSAAEVALPLTPIGAEHIQAIACSLSHSSSDRDNGTYNRASGEARRAAKDACSKGPCDPRNMQLDSPTVPALLCSSESAHTAAMQTGRSLLTDILKRSLGRVAEGKVAARNGLIAPADALQAAVLRLLVSKGDP